MHESRKPEHKYMTNNQKVSVCMCSIFSFSIKFCPILISHHITLYHTTTNRRLPYAIHVFASEFLFLLIFVTHLHSFFHFLFHISRTGNRSRYPVAAALPLFWFRYISKANIFNKHALMSSC